jgi:hypothetical protein
VPWVLWQHELFQDREDHGPTMRWMNHALVHMILNGDIDPTQILEYRCSGQYVEYNEVKKNPNGEIRYRNRFVPTTTARPGFPRPGFDNPTES